MNDVWKVICSKLSLSLLRLLGRPGFRRRRSGRMAGWLWLRCVLGPHLQRIHRSTDQSRPEARAGRRVGLFVEIYTG